MSTFPPTPKNWISFRVKPAEYQAIHLLFEKSIYRKFSDYARKTLLQQPVTIRHRNQSADEFLSQMLQLKKELNAIGHNYNQVVKRLHTLDKESEIKKWFTEYARLHDLLLEKTEQIFIKIHQLHQLWLSA